MRNIKIALWGLPALLTGLWLAASLPFGTPLDTDAIHDLLVQYSGVLALGAMSIGMILATRAKWLESWLNGLDKSYRLHKWLGIMALVMSASHWFILKSPDFGLITLPEEAAPGGALPGMGVIETFFLSQADLAEELGDLAFKFVVLLITLALIKRVPYKVFATTHVLLSVLYLVLVVHSVLTLDFAAWTQPLGIVVALLMAGGVVAALMSLTRQIGRRHRARGTIDTARTFPELDATAITMTMNSGWKGHDAGQFAFVTFDRREGKHPFTIASAWDARTRAISFISKGLGDYTDLLPDTLKIGAEATVEGPYGCFTFNDTKLRQIWIGAGVGITPFIARMKQLSKQGGNQAIDLIHSTHEVSQEALEMLRADAAAAGVTLHLILSTRDGHLTGEGLRARVPEWKSASIWFCGPTGFGESLQRDLVQNGLSEGDFHRELFEMR